jgi:hypothetical protein
MKYLDVTDNTTLYNPDLKGRVCIEIICEAGGIATDYVSFEDLKSWIASVEEPSNTQMHMGSLKPGEPCSHPGCCSHITHPCEGCGRTGCQ